MVVVENQYELELYETGRGCAIGRALMEVDWVPAREALIVDLLRDGALANLDGLGEVRIEPIWNERCGPPTIRGFRASLGEVSKTFSIHYFGDEAQRAATHFVKSGELNDGDLFEYIVKAHPRSRLANPARRFTITPKEPPIEIIPCGLRQLMGGALLVGGDDARDVPLFIHWNVLEEVSVLTRRAGPVETGGILIGHVCRDEAIPELFVEVSAQIPAPAEGALTRLSFSPQTWSAVQAAVDRRQSSELWLGWWHAHSFYKQRDADGDSEKQQGRRTATAFLSDEDRFLHRAVFPRAYSIALLVTDSPDSGMSWSAFGWRDGMIVPRAFHILGAPLPEEFLTQGEDHAKTPDSLAG